MKFPHKKNLAFIVSLLLFSYFVSSCINQDNWVDWKLVNEHWYEAHKNDAGLTLLPSGVSYKIIRLGNPTAGQPDLSSYIKATYTGRYFNDSIFDSRSNFDFSSPLGNTVAGFQEVLLKMHPNDSCVIYVPWNLGYGSTAGGVIPPYSTLKFNLRLHSFYNPQY